MNVKFWYKYYIHEALESFINIKWLKINDINIVFEDAQGCKHLYMLKNIKDFIVTA